MNFFFLIEANEKNQMEFARQVLKISQAIPILDVKTIRITNNNNQKKKKREQQILYCRMVHSFVHRDVPRPMFRFSLMSRNVIPLLLYRLRSMTHVCLIVFVYTNHCLFAAFKTHEFSFLSPRQRVLSRAHVE